MYFIVTKLTVHLPPTATSPLCKSTPPPHALLLEDEVYQEMRMKMKMKYTKRWRWKEDVNYSVHSMNFHRTV